MMGEGDDYRPPEDGVRAILTRQQINQCIRDIQDWHPLRTKVRYYHILGCLKCFKRKNSKMTFEYALRKTLLMAMEFEMDEQRREHDQAMEDDPFLLMGYGINAFFDLLLSLMKLCFVITIFCTPLYMAFGGFGFPNVSNLALRHEQKYFMNRFSLGNMGGSSVTCAKGLLAN